MTELLDMSADRIVIHQATGMIAAQLDDTTSNALARLRAAAFAAAALAVGVHAEFSLPLTAGPGGIGTLDLCRDRPGMLSEEHLADALVTADIARDAVLYRQYTPGGGGVTELLDMGADRIVIHQATGMIAAQLNDTTSNALARLRAAAFASGRPMYDIAQDVVERRMRFDD